ncbi:hypothetical protein ACJZ2D_014657 [Fusarium nematophilum]
MDDEPVSIPVFEIPGGADGFLEPEFGLSRIEFQDGYSVLLHRMDDAAGRITPHASPQRRPACKAGLLSWCFRKTIVGDPLAEETNRLTLLADIAKPATCPRARMAIDLRPLFLSPVALHRGHRGMVVSGKVLGVTPEEELLLFRRAPENAKDTSVSTRKQQLGSGCG